MNQLSLLNIIVAIAATGAGVFVLIWLFSAPVKKSKARGQGMMIGAMLHYIWGGQNENDES